MSLKTIAQSVARNVGIKVPASIIGNDTPDAVKLLQFINEAGQELARRVDWTATRKTVDIQGGGFGSYYTLPPDFSRLTSGFAVKVGGAPVRGGLTGDEWNALSPVQGTPRYFHMEAGKIGFYPFPAEGQTVSVTYQSNNWTSADKPEFAADTETSKISESLLAMGALWRFYRQIGEDFSDYMAEYEGALNDLSSFDDQARIP